LACRPWCRAPPGGRAGSGPVSARSAGLGVVGLCFKTGLAAICCKMWYYAVASGEAHLRVGRLVVPGVSGALWVGLAWWVGRPGPVGAVRPVQVERRSSAPPRCRRCPRSWPGRVVALDLGHVRLLEPWGRHVRTQQFEGTLCRQHLHIDSDYAPCNCPNSIPSPDLT
jgi:hypothetical protein